jgi:hypothetical protein
MPFRKGGKRHVETEHIIASYILSLLAIYPDLKTLANGKKGYSYAVATGSVIAADSTNSRYKIHFDRSELGIEYVADVDLMGHGPDLRISCVKGGTMRFIKTEDEERMVQKAHEPEEMSKMYGVDVPTKKEETCTQDQSILKGIVSNALSIDTPHMRVMGKTISFCRYTSCVD